MYLLKADSPILGSNRSVSVSVRERTGKRPRASTASTIVRVRPAPYDRSVLSMPATSAGVTLGTEARTTASPICGNAAGSG